MNILNKLIPTSAGGRKTAETFRRQLQERQAERSQITDITRLPFKIVMEVKGSCEKIGRQLAAAKLAWSVGSAGGD